MLSRWTWCGILRDEELFSRAGQGHSSEAASPWSLSAALVCRCSLLCKCAHCPHSRPCSKVPFHMQAKETAARQQPREVRIMKHLLSMEDPQQRRASLTEAFTPGPEVEVGGQDLLST